MSRVVERRREVESGVRRYDCFLSGSEGFVEGTDEGGFEVGKRAMWSGLFWDFVSGRVGFWKLKGAHGFTNYPYEGY